MYRWTPTAAVAGYDLVSVEFRHSPTPVERTPHPLMPVPAATTEGLMFKALRPNARRRRRRLLLLQNFTITTHDQLEMLLPGRSRDRTRQPGGRPGCGPRGRLDGLAGLSHRPNSVTPHRNTGHT